ncbi:hypothetical protein COW98_04200 [Candidatus Roizmanbacteria bacterium CG22_combo_CG10-13_8_21_14_all_35_9]|uniref:Uncharacterized protein n=4 Tax=Candidatus Roizmaniibacteriota TaxID=1752723 RepID=A0A2M8F3J9_9BACT|nr:MAG: hypothetical protein COX47_03740 [Candidatus Roizmanbacteria bacterium CG23_combo_of_CG06-09_8_20_14_all_35_49]PIP62410.1 MAG: hypothetical protein COW98_04200 [Candidatus Roizmanbacteria bacterium CG22_combo_CG10-13_8_21_14_all_35_9]PIY71378.1 MAG: hypothetical protein COY88_00620 [Candidatus Roizmanbacteria bacterium CG_4_10_14_0_8_um_filter_35_28]PJC33820.1 MAG: hypothetical protein CO048_02295 [Candidatus Roizmanbacteria bacterium CG_4_9_14_0_2_um_filter_35_15]PJC82548.1 MAG: hypoth
MNKYLQKVRFILFTKSYAGYILSNHTKKLHHPKAMINTLSKVLLFNKKDLDIFVFNKIKTNKANKIIILELTSDEKIASYLQIEKELINLMKERDDKENLVNDDYHHALLEPAIERVAGNNLSHIESDRWFDKRLTELKKKYHRWYYDIAYKYKLPTMRIVPFLLRLISPSKHNK